MFLRRAGLFAVVMMAAIAVHAAPAWGKTITVTTTGDETIANGKTSLREAVLEANKSGQNDTIQLQAGAHYLIDFCAAGPLTHTDSHALTIQGGAGTTLQNTCAEMQTIVDTNGAAGLIINSLEMTGFSIDDGVTVHGAAVRNEAGGSLVLSHVNIHGFTSGPSGSIVDGGDTGTSASIQSSEIWGNQGTGVKLSFGSLALADSQVHDNDGTGVGLIDGTPLTISGSTVSGNSGSGATTSGGGSTVLDVTDSQLNNNGDVGLGCSACDAVTITGSNISGNGSTAGSGDGGGVRATWDYDTPDDAPVLSITNSTVAFNRAARPGGGVFVSFVEDSEPTATPGQLNISGSTISANVTEDASDLDGGGVYAATGNVTVSNGSAISGNKAGSSTDLAEGGGIWHRELADLNGKRTLSIANSVVSSNQAGLGGGVYAAHNGTVSVTGSTLNDNAANSLSGGAMLTYGTNTTVTTSKIQGNDADTGGGLAHRSFSGLPVGSLTVDRTTVSGNTSDFGASGGGGIFVNVGGAGAQTTVRNSTVTNNTSAGNGGGVMVIQTSRLFLDHATVVRNTGGNGPGIGANVYVAAGTFRTRRAAIALPQGTGDNCAFFSAPSQNDGYSWSDDTSCNLGSNDVEDPGGDPLLGPLAMNGGPTPTRKPQSNTPLAIVPARVCTLTTDQRGTARPQGSKCEAGAVEITEAAPK